MKTRTLIDVVAAAAHSSKLLTVLAATCVWAGLSSPPASATTTCVKVTDAFGSTFSQANSDFLVKQETVGYVSGPVKLARNCSGTQALSVDDAIVVSVTRPDSSTSSFSHDFSNGCAGVINPAGPFDLTSRFQPGTNAVTFRFRDLCGQGGSGSSSVYIVLESATIDFDWRVPDRFGGDSDANGMLDYFAPDGFLEVKPDGFRVDFTTATPAACDTTASRIWSIDGTEVQTGDPRILLYDPQGCEFRYRFATEGVYDVELEIEDGAGNLLGFKSHRVIVQDWLIVSVGDSVASGEGNPDVPQLGAPERWQNQQCHRTASAGPAQAALATERADPKTSVTFVHLACSGGRIDEGILGRYRGVEPGAWLPPQIEVMKALVGAREIDAVLISVGANDVRFSKLIEKCFVFVGCDLIGPGSASSLFEQGIVRLPPRYDALAASLVPLTSSRRVHVTEYFDPTRDDAGTPCGTILADHPAGGGLLEITPVEAQWASESMLVRLNAEVVAAAARHQWRFVGGITSQFVPHGYCAAANWIVTFSESQALQGDQNGTLHPNVPGHVAYGNRLSASLRAELYDGGDLAKPRPAMP